MKVHELWFFGHREHAYAAGFVDGRHRSDPTMISWCIKGGDPSSIYGLRFSKVIVTEYAGQFARHKATAYQHSAYTEMRHQAAFSLTEAPAVWIEL